MPTRIMTAIAEDDCQQLSPAGDHPREPGSSRLNLGRGAWTTVRSAEEFILVRTGRGATVTAVRWPPHGRASRTRLNGVSAARRKRVKPAVVTTSRKRVSPAW